MKWNANTLFPSAGKAVQLDELLYWRKGGEDLDKYTEF